MSTEKKMSSAEIIEGLTNNELLSVILQQKKEIERLTNIADAQRSLSIERYSKITELERENKSLTKKLSEAERKINELTGQAASKEAVAAPRSRLCETPELKESTTIKAKESYSVNEMKLLATYEELFNVPHPARVTYGLPVFKYTVMPNEIQDVYNKALKAIGLSADEFKAKRYVDRADIVAAMQENAKKNGIATTEQVAPNEAVAAPRSRLCETPELKESATIKAKESYSVSEMKLLATYEELFKVPHPARVTYWYGDSGLHVFKYTARPNEIQDVYEKALKAIGLSADEFKAKRYVDRADIVAAMQENAKKNGIATTEQVAPSEAVAAPRRAIKR